MGYAETIIVQKPYFIWDVRAVQVVAIQRGNLACYCYNSQLIHKAGIRFFS